MEAPLPPAAITTPEGWPGKSPGRFGRLPTPPRGPSRHPRQRIPPETVVEDQSPLARRSSEHIPQISWGPERLPPRLFLDKYSVPRVVRMSTEGDGGVDDASTTTAVPRAMPLSPTVAKGHVVHPSVDLSRPILLYRQYRCGRVQAKSLRKRGVPRKGPQQRHWEESGPAIAIPEEYGGWFTLVGDNGQQLAPCFTSIGHVASARLHFFLTRFDLPAYKLISPHDLAPGEKGKSIYSKTTVRSGQVLRLMGVFEDTKASMGAGVGMSPPSGLEGQMNGSAVMSGARRTDARLSSFLQRLSRGSNGRPRDAMPLPGARFPALASKYAQCLTQLNEVVFVPLKSPGRFYAASLPSSRSSGGRVARMNSLLSSSSSSSTASSSSSSSCSARSFSPAPPAVDPRRAFTLSQLLRSRPLPVRVHLICGALPVALPSGFTGTLLLEEWHREEVVLACTLPEDGAHCSLLEMELDSRLLLTRPLRHEARIARSPSVRAALAFCRDHAEDWRRNIKVTHHVFPGENRREASTAKEDNHFNRHQNHNHQVSKGPTKSVAPPVLFASTATPWKGDQKSGVGGDEEELPYSRVWDEVTGPDEAAEENIYAEICEPEAEERTPGGDSRYYYMRAGGGSDGTLSGTMSSSSPEDEFLYDSVC